MNTVEKKVSHTPGPWFPIQYGGFWDVQTDPFYGDTSVLNVENHPEAEANAKLAAAAPELLEALSGAFTAISHAHNYEMAEQQGHINQAEKLDKAIRAWKDKAIEAIKKATS